MPVRGDLFARGTWTSDSRVQVLRSRAWAVPAIEEKNPDSRAPERKTGAVGVAQTDAYLAWALRCVDRSGMT